IPEWETSELLSREKSVLGVYVTGHPFGAYSKYFQNCSFHTGFLSDFEEDEETGDRTYRQIKSGMPVSMGGIIAGIKKVNTRSGSVMAFVTVEDLYGSVECLAFPQVYERIKSNLKQDAVVKITGKIDTPSEKLPVVIIDKLEEFVPPEEKKETEKVSPLEKSLWLDARKISEEEFAELIDTLEGYAGTTKTKILHGGKRFEYSVNLTRAFLAEVRTLLSEECIKIV
ncbi:MAG: hypothetical protein K2K12_04320, partial [Clostridia bacterium]|nr:hypothetical protein [Clostridia bacterium]